MPALLLLTAEAARSSRAGGLDGGQVGQGDGQAGGSAPHIAGSAVHGTADLYRGLPTAQLRRWHGCPSQSARVKEGEGT